MQKCSKGFVSLRFQCRNFRNGIMNPSLRGVLRSGQRDIQQIGQSSRFFGSKGPSTVRSPQTDRHPLTPFVNFYYQTFLRSNAMYWTTLILFAVTVDMWWTSGTTALFAYLNQGKLFDETISRFGMPPDTDDEEDDEDDEDDDDDYDDEDE